MTETDADNTDDVEYWATPTPHDASQGTPVADLQPQGSRVVAWLATRLAIVGDGDESAVFSAAYSQAAPLASALRRLADGGRRRVNKIELDSFVDEATRSDPGASIVAEPSHMPATSHQATLPSRRTSSSGGTWHANAPN